MSDLYTMVRVCLLALKLLFPEKMELLPCFLVNVVCVGLEGEFIVNGGSHLKSLTYSTSSPLREGRAQKTIKAGGK